MDVSDPTEIEAKRIAHIRLQAAYKQIFADPNFDSGQLVLSHLLKEGHVLTPVLAATEQQTLVNAAEQAFVLNIVKFSELNPQTIIEKTQEYARNRNAR